MSLLFFKRVLANPMRVGYIVPSSPFLTGMVARRLDFSKPRVIVELGPGEGCHTRKIVKRMTPDSHLILIELDEEFCAHLTKSFAEDKRVTVLHTDALHLPELLKKLGHDRCDYIVSGIPFLVVEEVTRGKILNNIADVMDEDTRFITYQVTTQIIDQYNLFDLLDKEYCPLNVPPINVFEFRKALPKAAAA
ncbi:rRNA adenine N-6-methyltransferase family protein [soil metagenome]